MDIDDEEVAATCVEIALRMLGPAPEKYRSNSPRRTLVYRAAEGEPQKRTLVGTKGKIEILGKGQQFVAFGTHPSGAELLWRDRDLYEIARDDLTAITEDHITLYFEEVAPILGAAPQKPALQKLAPPLPAPDPRSRHSDARIQAYCDAAIAAEVATVERAGEGERNNALNEAAFALGQLVGAGWVSEGEISSLLENAAYTNGLVADDGLPQTRATIRSGIGAGRKQPRTLPENVDTMSAFNGYNNIVLLPRPQEEQPSSKLEWFDDIQLVIQSPYIIKGTLDWGAMSVVYGPSNSGKTFFALDVAFHVAINSEWRGKRVHGGSVLYLAAEGGNGIANRMAALRSTSGVVDVPLALRRAGLDLLNPRADTNHVLALAAEVAERGDLALIVVDTLSRVIAGGDENAASDMTAFIKNVDLIRQRTGAHLMIIHHTGKDAAKGARGHSSLRAATDTEIEIMVDDFGNHVAKVNKQRDYQGGDEFVFDLKSVFLGQDQDGDDVTSCVVEIMEKPKDVGGELPPMDKCRAILNAIDEAWREKNPLSTSPQTKHSGRYAARFIAKQFSLNQGAVQRLLEAWLDNAVVATEECDNHTKKRGLRVLKWL
jgi:hypothetical protein